MRPPCGRIFLYLTCIFSTTPARQPSTDTTSYVVPPFLYWGCNNFTRLAEKRGTEPWRKPNAGVYFGAFRPGDAALARFALRLALSCCTRGQKRTAHRSMCASDAKAQTWRKFKRRLYDRCTLRQQSPPFLPPKERGARVPCECRLHNRSVNDVMEKEGYARRMEGGDPG